MSPATLMSTSENGYKMYKKSSIVSKKDMIPSISSLTKNQEYAHSSKNTRFIYPPLSPNNANLHQNGIIPNSKYGASKRIHSNFNSKYMDIPSQTDPHGPAIIYGVESEELEEINDAYNDLVMDLGLSKEREDDFEEIVPSCGPLLVIEYLVYKMEIFWSKSSSNVSNVGAVY